MTRLTWICHGSTAANRAGRFPLDEPLEERAVIEAERFGSRLQRADRMYSSPALRARQTAEALSFKAETAAELSDCDYGRWAGLAIDDLQTTEPENLMIWMTDPQAAPHGGESIAQICERAAAWMVSQSTLRGHIVAISHAAMIRAAILHVLEAPLSSFWRTDIEPLAVVRMTHNGSRWTLRF
jgi:broad specificity phosphatase PhoE